MTPRNSLVVLSILVALIISVNLSCATLAQGATPPTAVSTDKSVIGSGSTSDAAYKDAYNRLPSGAQVTTVSTRQSGDTWYCTIYYR